jgi:hypothetical protein
MTHRYKRHGTTTLFAGLNVKTGEVIGECLPKHRAREFIAFLKTIDRTIAKSRKVHLVLDNYATHKTAEVNAWLDKHPRFKLHFTPTSAVVAQSGRAAVRRDHAPAHPARRLHQRRRAEGSHHGLDRGPQHQPEAVRVDCQSGRNHRQARPSEEKTGRRLRGMQMNE